MPKFERGAIVSLVQDLWKCPTCARLMLASDLPTDFDSIAAFLTNLQDRCDHYHNQPGHEQDAFTPV